MDLESLGGWPGILARLMGGRDLAAEEAATALDEVLAGRATPAQLAGFLVALRVKGEAVPEMAGLVKSLLAHAEKVPVPTALVGRLVDTCGTGGDRSQSINVSTLSALVVAGAGAVVCKHGNRALSSRTGSADVLEALGVAIDLAPDGVARCLDEAGLAFCYAPRYHPALRHAGPTRRELGVATAFNFLGPLVNPARPTRQVVGVSDPSMAETLLGVLAANGATRAMVVFGHDGLDELTTTTTSTLLYLRDGEVSRLEVDPVALGIATATADQLKGAGPAANAEATRRVLDGTRGPHRDLVVLNAAAGLVVAGLAPDLAGGLDVARHSLDDGAAADALERLVTVSQAASAATS
ncbi:MAG: anthranilate phosphoribosyltransferase [Acidimicrobiales bacterium]